MPRDSEDWVHQLYVQHAPDLYRVAKYRLQDPELAYDLTQEVFLTLLDHPNRVKGHPNSPAAGCGKPYSIRSATPCLTGRSAPAGTPGQRPWTGSLPRTQRPPWRPSSPGSCRTGTRPF